MFSLLYISQSCLIMPDQERCVQDIVSVGRSRNKALDVTGALIFTETHFAQILEGAEDRVAELMRSIVRDERHTNVDIILRERLGARRFCSWSLAYAGPADLVADIVSPLLTETRERRDASRLTTALVEMATITG